MAIIDNEKYLLSGSQIKKITTEIQSKADAENVYTKTETDALLNDKADKATTLDGYGIEDAYTKTEIDSKLDDCIKGVKVNDSPLIPDENGVVNVETLTLVADEIEHSVSIGDKDRTSSFYILPNESGAFVQIKVNGQTESTDLVDKTYVDTELDKKKITLSSSTDIDLSFSGTVSDDDKSIAVNLLNTGDSATADITVSGEDSKSISVPSVAKMNKAILDALGEITEIEIEVVDQLPATGVKGVFYFVPVSGSTTPDLYDEYVWVTPEGETPHFELIGSTRVDLSNYYDKDETDALLNLKADKTELIKYMLNKSTLDTFDIEDDSGKNVLKVVDNTAGLDVSVKTDEDPYGGLDLTKTLTDIIYVDGRLDEKQDALIVGENITIENNEISATDTTYTAGNGLVLTDTEFSADTTVLATQTDLADGLALKADKTELDTKQDVLTAGDNISIVVDTENDTTTISATDTTYTAGTGLTLTDTEFSIDSTVVATKTDLDNYYTKTEVDNLIPDVTDFITKDVNDLTYYTTTADLETALDLKADKTELDSYYTKTETDALLDEKQDVLTAGSNISIVEDSTTGETTISATNTTYTAGNGLTLTDTEFSVDTTVIAEKSELPDMTLYYTKTESDTLLDDKADKSELLNCMINRSGDTYFYITDRNAGGRNTFGVKLERPEGPTFEVTSYIDPPGYGLDLTTTLTDTDYVNGELAKKQDVLTAGANITIVADPDTGELIISSSGGSGTAYTAGDGILIENDTISVDFATDAEVSTMLTTVFGA